MPQNHTEWREPFYFSTRIFANGKHPREDIFARLSTAVFVDKRHDPGFGPEQKILDWLPR